MSPYERALSCEEVIQHDGGRAVATRTQTTTFTLYDEDIDLFSEWLDDAQKNLGVERKNRMRVRILIEDIMLHLRDHVGAQAHVAVTCESFLGRSRLRVELPGKPHNPLNSLGTDLGSWESSLRTAIGFSPHCAYEGGCNVLRLSLPRTGINPVVQIALALSVGALMDMVGRAIIAAPMVEAISDLLIAPLYAMWMRLLTAISGPVIFLTVTTTMLNTQQLRERGGSSLLVIARYFAISFLTVAFALLCARFLFPARHAGIAFTPGLVRSFLNTMAGIVPSNIIAPLDAHTSQLLFLAFAFGYVLTRLSGQVNQITGFIREANVVGLQLAGWVSRLVPVAVATFVCLEVWDGEVEMLLQLWQPLTTALAISLVTMLVVELLVAQSMRVSPLRLLMKLLPPFASALRSGSLDESFTDAQRTCIDELGIDRDFVCDGLPQGLVLYMPVSAVGTIVFTLFAARMVDVEVNMAWYLAAIAMVVVVFVATPPVPGANLLAYVMLFSTLGVPENALVDAMIFDIIFGIFAAAANQFMLQVEMVKRSSRLGLLRESVLRGK